MLRHLLLPLLSVLFATCTLPERQLSNMLGNIGANRAHLLVNTLNDKFLTNHEKIVELFDDKVRVAACDLKGGKGQLKGYLDKFNKELVDSVKFTMNGANSKMQVERGQYAFDYKFESKSPIGMTFEADGTAVIDINKRQFVMIRQSCPTPVTSKKEDF